jgi:hypothetical protein
VSTGYPQTVPELGVTAGRSYNYLPSWTAGASNPTDEYFYVHFDVRDYAFVNRPTPYAGWDAGIQ